MENICSSVDSQIDKYQGKVDGIVESLLGIVGNHPWKEWTDVANRMISKYAPFIIALSGILGVATLAITAIKNEMPTSMLMKYLAILVPVFFSIHLAPKALALVRSLVEKNEELQIRPELMYILKVLIGLGGLLGGLYFLLHFSSDKVMPGVVCIVVAAIMTICLSRPEVLSIKAGYPTNGVEEIVAILLLPVRVLLALVTLIIGIALIGGFVFGIVQWFKNGITAGTAFSVTALLPLVLPIVLYIAYLVLVFAIDFYRAIVSIPRKLDELKK